MAIAESKVLRKAVRGLLFPSQIDAPFKIVSFPTDEDITSVRLTELLQLPADTPVEEMPFTAFFADLTRIEKWHAEDDRALIRRYQELLVVLRENLTDLHVFRAGEVRVHLYIIGRTTAGSWAGLETLALEP